jgi:hypothetical protein
MKAHLHFGKNRSKLARFKEHKMFRVYKKPSLRNFPIV